MIDIQDLIDEVNKRTNVNVTAKRYSEGEILVEYRISIQPKRIGRLIFSVDELDHINMSPIEVIEHHLMEMYAEWFEEYQRKG